MYSGIDLQGLRVIGKIVLVVVVGNTLALTTHYGL